MFLRLSILLMVFITIFSQSSCTRNEVSLTPILVNDTSDFEIDSTLYEIEKYKVYDKIIEQSFYFAGMQIIIQDSTASDDFINEDLSFLPDLSSYIPQLKQETQEIYIQFNQRRYRLLNYFSDSLNVHLISRTEFKNILSTGGWKYFYQLYPSFGLINFTNPGFDRYFSQCIVYLGHEANYRAGSGKFFFLEKANEEWFIKYEKIVWVS